MRDHFEIRDGDVAGRIGELTVPRAGVTVETPALLPVINPNIVTVSPARLESEFGAQILITNSYIIHKNDDLHEEALDVGLHEMLDFDGAIMTDSGSFQLAEYGDITVTTREILQFQYDIGTDIGTPVDIPTPPDVPREQAERELAVTEEALQDAEDVDTGEMLVNAPVQGSTYPDLREEAGRAAYETDLDVFPIGAVVPLMNSYRYDDMVDVVAGAKRGLGRDAPIHLFGAGHPMMFALAVAMGCDLFDSAAYALYARDGRYLTVRGTEHLEDLDYLPCSCPICTSHSPDELRAADETEQERLLAEHNLHVSFEELHRVKQAIRSGNLLELVEERARSHPAMLDGYRALLEHTDQLEREDPVSKGSFFYLSEESAFRPEVRRHHDRLARLDATGTVLLTQGGTPKGDQFDATWRVVPPFGPFPRALSETYPLTAEVPDRTDRAAYEMAAEGVARLAAENPETAFVLAHDGWPESALERVPDDVTTESIHSVSPENGEETV
ncbi:7-cyano-7-deazaguanine tRNA-ribosyltransferase [Halogeometricum borinquense DSM 11551]|uniref:tRNA-guanine(15) transglycosylase n=1 Tax=Halogeometricum borinquense (strain ATCC 700274 / DSM 11551 / JCM 10706 / KCTC 4070 / PR3) TaxID=469382 RepID=E4NMP7_HALBP|nr:tRNA guanosine(15) transglycosylase TgtA [Halogeometricum borinquense]ADQ66202.1 archaeosine tRNA-ribosyltransferase [Halogeometricum borinquense DSM 11551]ELY27303.1 7-cyano-7-deazaguanine tRNA-ribosyltransferase [Halogeometricum borinquense DSM 11551]